MARDKSKFKSKDHYAFCSFREVDVFITNQFSIIKDYMN